MSIFSKLKDRVKIARLKTKVITAGFTLAVAGVAAVAAVGNAAAAAISTPDCDTNAVIVCGANDLTTLKHRYNNGADIDGINDSAKSIRNIYSDSAFGIMSNDINTMNSSNTFTGYVTSGGDVFTGDPQGAHALVATDALTAGRLNSLPKCTPQTCVRHDHNGTVFYTRKPSISFANSPLKAFIVMKDGVFQFAILNSCGNPVVGHPKKPNYSILKQVREVSPKSTSYSSNVTVPSGATVEYQITVNSTGPIAVKNVTVRDHQPSDVTYNSGTLKENGNPLAAKDVTSFFSNGFLIPSIAANGKDVFTFEAQAGKVSATDPSCKPQSNLTNTGYITAPGLPNGHDTAQVTTQCTPPQVSLQCVNLALDAGAIDPTTGDQSYTLTATAHATNATITGYKFVVRNGQLAPVTIPSTNPSITHSFVPGNWTVNVTVLATANGKQLTATSPACQKQFPVKPPVTSSLTCKQLTAMPGTADSNGDTPYTLAAVAAESNATVTQYVFTPGDGSADIPVNTTTNALTASTTHTYAPGTYTASVAVSGLDVNGKPLTVPTNPKCSKTFTVKITECKPGIPIGSPQCSPSSLTCQGLSDVPGNVDPTTGGQDYTFTGQASADNATITTYTFNFGDGASLPITSGASSVTTPSPHTYAPGSYVATLTVSGTDASGNPIQAPTVKKCSIPIKVKSPECKPGVPEGSEQCFVYTCNDFTVSIDNVTRTVTVASFDATSTNSNATLTNVLIDWGDGNSSTVNAQDAVGQPHAYSIDSATIKATGLFTVEGQDTPVSSTQCAQPVSFTTTPPPMLPNTGAGDTIAIFFGTVVAGTIGSRLFIRRKLSRR